MKLLIRDRENIEIGKELGNLSKTIHLIRHNRSKFSTEQLTSLLDLDESSIQKITECMDAHPDWNDEEIAVEIIESRK